MQQQPWRRRSRRLHSCLDLLGRRHAGVVRPSRHPARRPARDPLCRHFRGLPLVEEPWQSHPLTER